MKRQTPDGNLGSSDSISTVPKKKSKTSKKNKEKDMLSTTDNTTPVDAHAIMHAPIRVSESEGVDITVDTDEVLFAPVANANGQPSVEGDLVHAEPDYGAQDWSTSNTVDWSMQDQGHTAAATSSNISSLSKDIARAVDDDESGASNHGGEDAAAIEAVPEATVASDTPGAESGLGPSTEQEGWTKIDRRRAKKGKKTEAKRSRDVCVFVYYNPIKPILNPP
jgi:hypothetical protein